MFMRTICGHDRDVPINMFSTTLPGGLLASGAFSFHAHGSSDLIEYKNETELNSTNNNHISTNEDGDTYNSANRKL